MPLPRKTSYRDVACSVNGALVIQLNLIIKMSYFGMLTETGLAPIARITTICKIGSLIESYCEIKHFSKIKKICPLTYF